MTRRWSRCEDVCLDRRARMASGFAHLATIVVLVACAAPSDAMWTTGQLPMHLGVETKIVGDFAYTLSGGLRILSVADPSNPVQIGFAARSGNFAGFEIVGPQIYAADTQGRIVRFEASDPANPRFIAAAYSPGAPREIAIAGQTAYLACNTGDLQIFDLSPPGAPVLRGSIALPGLAYDVAVSGDVAFVATGSSGIQLVDVSDPAHPLSIGSLPTASINLEQPLRLDGAHLYVGDLTTLLVYEVANPATPTLVGSHALTGRVEDIEIVGTRAYVGGSAGVTVLDITDPTSPVDVGTLATPSDAVLDLSVYGTTIFARHVFETYVVDVSKPERPRIIGGYDIGQDGLGVEAVRLAGERAYLVSKSPPVFAVLDVSDPSSPSWLGEVALPPQGQAMDIELVGSDAYVLLADSPLLVAVDVSDPTAPSVVGSLPLVEPGSYGLGFEELAVGGGFAYSSGTEVTATEMINKLSIVDVSDPSALVEVADQPPAGGVFDFAVVGDRLYATGATGLTIYDVGDPPNLTVLGTLATSVMKGMAVEGGRALLFRDAQSTLGSAVSIVDVSDPTAPVELGQFATRDRVFGLELSGDTAIAFGVVGALVYDISDPTSPISPGGVRVYSSVVDLERRGSHLFLGDQRDRFHVVDLGSDFLPFLSEPPSVPGLGAVGAIALAGCLLWGYRRSARHPIAGG